MVSKKYLQIITKKKQRVKCLFYMYYHINSVCIVKFVNSISRINLTLKVCNKNQESTIFTLSTLKKIIVSEELIPDGVLTFYVYNNVSERSNIYLTARNGR